MGVTTTQPSNNNHEGLPCCCSPRCCLPECWWLTPVLATLLMISPSLQSTATSTEGLMTTAELTSPRLSRGTDTPPPAATLSTFLTAESRLSPTLTTETVSSKKSATAAPLSTDPLSELLPTPPLPTLLLPTLLSPTQLSLTQLSLTPALWLLTPWSLTPALLSWLPMLLFLTLSWAKMWNI